jgi:hypothetical protein
MKKVIALVLAVALSLSMASVVFATDWTSSDGTNKYDSSKTIAPGDKIKFVFGDFSDAGVSSKMTNNNYMSSNYFNVKVEYDRGKELVKEVKFDGGGLVIVLKDDVIEKPSISNFKIKKITLTGKKDGTEATEKFRNKKFELKGPHTFFDGVKVGYDVVTSALNKDGFNVNTKDAAVDGKIVKFVDADYGVATIDFAGYASAEVRLYKNEKYFFGVKADADLDIVKANPDADLEFLNFTGAPTFSANAKVEIYADENKYLYEIKDGKLVESTFKYDEDAYAFVGKARTLGKYVISDMKLVAAATAEETKNPDTGANDVVGVAVALAVVSLVAAGAVSLKK